MFSFEFSGKVNYTNLIVRSVSSFEKSLLEIEPSRI